MSFKVNNHIFRDLKAWLIEGSLETRVLRSSKVWSVSVSEEEDRPKGYRTQKIENNLRPYAPIDLIDLTLKRLKAKTEKRLELMRIIKKIQKQGKIDLQNLSKIIPEVQRKSQKN